MKRILCFSILCLCTSLILNAQNSQRPTKVKVGMPEVLKPKIEGTYKASDLAKEIQSNNKWGTKKSSKTYWEVWSDRDHNTVYTTSSGSTKAKVELPMGERVIIVEVENNRAYVIRKNDGQTFPAISNQAEILGWVPMDNLLLWGRCPTNDLGVQQKALIAIHLNNMNSNYEKAFYRTPENHNNPLDLSMDMQFYFIMKVVGNHVLLCENPSVLPGGKNLKGWVENTNYTPWEQRACLEPNWDVEYNERNKGKEVSMYIYPSLTSGSILHFPYGKSNGDSDPTSNYRMHQSLLRFPILKAIDDSDDFVHCTAFANYKTKNLDTYNTNVNNQVNTIKKNRRQMNLIFVIEAMSGMEDYLEAVKTSLGKCGRYTNQGFIVKAGLVLYHNSGAPNAIETCRLSNYDDPKLLSMLNRSKASVRWPNTNRSVALQEAIATASDPAKMGFNKDQNNLIILVGNNGADKNVTLTEKTLSKKLDDNNINFLSVQIVTTGTGSPAVYNDQILNLNTSIMNEVYKQLGSKWSYASFPGKDGYAHKSTKYSKNNILFYELRYPAKDGGKLTGQDVTKYVDNGIYRFSEASTNWSNHFEESLSTIGFDDAFLKKFLGNNLYSSYKKNSDISAFDGYAPLKDSDDENYWHYIVYLSNDELADLLNKLKPAYHASKNSSDDRKEYINAMRILAQQLAGQQNDKEIEKMSIQDLQKLIWGLNVRTTATSRKLDAIKDPSIVKRPEYVKILRDFQERYEALQKIHNGKYKYRYLFGSDYYYWIPVEDLP